MRPLIASRLGIERVAQAVAHQVEREHRDQDREARQRDDPPRALDELERAREHRAPLGRRRLRAQAEEAERGRVEDGGREASVACTMSGAAQLGSTVSNISRAVPAPAMRDA
jgi:hypothetical protein